MFSMKFSARLYASRHAQPHPFKDAVVVASSLTSTNNAVVKCLFIVNRSYIHKGSQVSAQETFQIQIWRETWSSVGLPLPIHP
jgi:hypothetical protein